MKAELVEERRMKMVIVEGRKYDLSKAYRVPDSDTRENGGVSREGVWVTNKGTVIVETYSIWEDRNTHGVIGQRFHVADDWEIAYLADELRDERLMELVPEGD